MAITQTLYSIFIW